MSKLLTLAIPTYNRAQKLDAQLAWLSRNIAGVEHSCDVIISDNASTDNTLEVCRKWQRDLMSRGVDFRINRNENNLGPLRNIARCIELSTTRFSWVIGDDDEIPDDKLIWVVARLEADPHIASIVLNFRGVGKSVYDRCFHHDADLFGDGPRVMGECLRQAYFGLAFMTAQIYRTAHAQEALRAWPEGLGNYDFQVFLTAYAGRQGNVLATRETHCTYVTGDNVYEKNKRVGLILYADTMEVVANLRRIGYDAALCRSVAWRHLWQLKRRFVKRALQNNPLLTLATVGRILFYLAYLESSRLTGQKARTAPASSRLPTISATPVAS